MLRCVDGVFQFVTKNNHFLELHPDEIWDVFRHVSRDQIFRNRKRDFFSETKFFKTRTDTFFQDQIFRNQIRGFFSRSKFPKPSRNWQKSQDWEENRDFGISLRFFERYTWHDLSKLGGEIVTFSGLDKASSRTLPRSGPFVFQFLSLNSNIGVDAIHEQPLFNDWNSQVQESISL